VGLKADGAAGTEPPRRPFPPGGDGRKPAMITARCWFRSLAAGVVLIAGMGLAAAQSPPATDAPAQGPQATDAPKDVPNLQLSASQKQTIYQGLTGPQAKNNPEPVGFRAAAGAQVPEAIKLEPLPKVVVDLVPKLSSYQYAVVSRQVIIVDPDSKTVVEVIAQ
jgi:Protein of unknown function (DUF1236)